MHVQNVLGPSKVGTTGHGQGQAHNLTGFFVANHQLAIRQRIGLSQTQVQPDFTLMMSHNVATCFSTSITSATTGIGHRPLPLPLPLQLHHPRRYQRS